MLTLSTQKFIGEVKEIPWNTIVTLDGKGSAIYNAHPYHTKLSLEICKKIIQELTKQNDTVLDFFCGSGIVGAASLLSNRNTILSDISPYAVHIASGLTMRAEPTAFTSETKRIVENVRKKVGHLVLTKNKDKLNEFSYLVWSDFVHCSSCAAKFLLWDVALKKDGSISQTFKCPCCNILLDKRKLERSSGKPVEVVFWTDGKRQQRKRPDTTDLEIANNPREPKGSFPWRPDVSMLGAKAGKPWGEQWRKGYHKSIHKVSDFFSNRNWAILAYIWEEIEKTENSDLKSLLKLAFTGTLVNVSRMVRYIPSRGGRSNTPGTLYCPTVWLEQNPILVFERRTEKIKRMLNLTNRSKSKSVKVSNSSASDLSFLPSESVDLIVTDPPFGANIQYAELNFIPEAWLQKFTNVTNEAVENPFRKQDRSHYNEVMKKSISEAYRVLKKGKYMAFFFNSTDVTLWKDLKHTFEESGFKIVKSVPALKGQAGWNQVRHKRTVAGWDPIIFLWKGEGQSPATKNTKPSKRVTTDEYLRECIASDQTQKYSYQLWYSNYISNWFTNRIADNIIDIKDFVGKAEKIVELHQNV